MPGAIVVGLAAAVGAALALAGGTTPAAPLSPFGGAVAVHIAHVGRIETPPDPSGGVLVRVRCDGLPAGAAACWEGVLVSKK